MSDFRDVLDEMIELQSRKSQDYGITGDPYANLRASEDFGIPAWIGSAVRMNDKIRRLQAVAKGSKLVNEGVEDSLLDLATYAILTLILYRETIR